MSPAAVPSADAVPVPHAGRPEADERRDLAATLIEPVEGHATSSAEELPEVAPQPVQRQVRTIHKTKPTRRLAPGDLICGICGEGNVPTRKFCSRCGESLDHAEEVDPTWLQRVVRFFRNRRKHPAGTRPGQKGTARHRKWRMSVGVRRLRTAMGIIVILLTLVYLAFPPVRRSVNSAVQEIFQEVRPSLKPVRPTSITANDPSFTTPQHPIENITDQFSNTYWVSPTTQSKLPSFTVTFGGDYIISDLILHSGASDDYVNHGRPQILKLTFSDSQTVLLNPTDTPDGQTLKTNKADLVRSVVIEVEDIYLPQNHTQDVAISEIEFFALE
ncbi:discoidin domain-containing protein [Amycolatopsis sp. SID8362]|uniref:discoidin domain-containing protein n=1 Tax=Amycolatopsis sp. SID8362 TaxID=2690346 RepID=UPI001368035F|nr:discoidin domain-containing protein [Amycolatopsis sp. SID8362]NBH06063.1 hypothetical protein [Amycolatopsis sp. SID8362]NED42762.1 discoidin domain-containing protein [Amycolatopsis sp. SID8362]